MTSRDFAMVAEKRFMDASRLTQQLNVVKDSLANVVASALAFIDHRITTFIDNLLYCNLSLARTNERDHPDRGVNQREYSSRPGTSMHRLVLLSCWSINLFWLLVRAPCSVRQDGARARSIMRFYHSV